MIVAKTYGPASFRLQTTPLLSAVVFSFLSHGTFASPQATPPDASARPLLAPPMRRAWRMEGLQLLSQNRGNTRAGMILVVGQGQTMSAVERASGRTLWTASDALPAVWNSRVDASPSYVLVSSNENVVAYSADAGKRLWIGVPPCRLLSLRAQGEVAVGHCLAKCDGCGSVDGTPLLALDMRTGAVRWKHVPKQGLFWDQLDMDRLFYIDSVRRPPPGPHSGHLVALELTSGRVVWRARLDDADGTLVVGKDTVVLLGSEIAPGTLLASFVDLQNAINDPNMRGTLVIAHGGPGGVIWEVAPGEDPSDIEGESMSPPGFTDAHLEHNSPLAGRPATMRKPERVWLLGCKVGRLKTGWASTFGVAPQNLYAPMGFSAGKDPCIAKRTCEPTVPKLQQVLNWIRRRKQIQ